MKPIINEIERAIETIEGYIKAVEQRMQSGDCGVVVGYDAMLERRAGLKTSLDLCRAELSRQENAPLTCGLQTIYCTPYSCEYCGDHIAVGWAFCPECGTPTKQKCYEPKGANQ